MVCGNGRMMIRFLIGLWILMSSILVHACDFDHQIESIERKIKKPRKILDNNSLDDVEVVKRHLTIMYAVDQEVRKLFIVFDNPTTRKLLTEVDFFHTEHLKAILAIHGWIIMSKFGKEADHQAWLLVQHTDHDPEFQKRCVLLLQHLYPSGETDKKNYAYLYDRVALKFQDLGLKQRCGTQAKMIDNKIELYPFEGSLEDLNQHRHEMDLGPVEDYMETLKTFYKG